MSLEILAYEPTELGLLCLRRRELLSQPGVSVTEVTLNHEFLMSSYLTQSEEVLAKTGVKLALETLGEGKLEVLVGGLGLGYTAAAALASEQVVAVEVVEYLPQVIGWMKEGLVPLAKQLNQDCRFTTTQGDIYGKLTGKPDRLFDLIVIDVDHSPEDVLGGQSEGFYSAEGLEKAKQHLNVNGILGVWSYAESTPLLDNMKIVFAEVQVEQVTVENDLINEMQTDWLFFGRRVE